MNSSHLAYDRGFLRGLEPDPIFTVSDWADRYRVLSGHASAEPGPWRTSRTPYLKEIMDALSVTSPIEEVVFMKGAQVGGTEAGNNWIGYVIDYAPGPFLAVQPTVELAKRNSKQRIDPLIENCSALLLKVKAKRSRESGNTILQKDFPGGTLVMTGANSAVGLRSLPARFELLDEIDAYPGDVDGEGDPILLAEARTRTFARRRKIFKISTPTIAGRSRIESAYEDSDKRKFLIPCPHCEHFQELRWSQLRWPEGAVHLAKYICENCEQAIDEHLKTKFLAAGKWVAEKPGARLGKVAGFHLNSLYSPLGWYSWAEAARDFEKAKGTPELLRGFVNTVLGETWKDRGDAPDWKRIYERRDDYEFNQVPRGGIFLVAGVDVQKDRLEMEIVAYGRDKRSWSIDYRVFLGDTSNELVWSKLEEVVSETWPLWNKILAPLKMVAVDSGFNTQMVYSWVRKFPFTRVVAVKGSQSLPVMIGKPSAVDVTTRGRTIRRGLKIWPIGVDLIKNELYGFLRQDKPIGAEVDPTGFCHFPQYGEDYFKQLTAEELVVTIVKGFKRYDWQKTRERNEALDCRVYARAAAAICGIDRYKESDWLRIEGELSMLKPIVRSDAPIVEKSAPKPVAASKRRSSFWDKN